MDDYTQSDFLADSERESSRNGYLSYRAEWHSAMWGIAVGIAYLYIQDPNILMGGVGWLITRGTDGKVPERIPYPDQFVNESLYVLAHCGAVVLLGTALQTVL